MCPSRSASKCPRRLAQTSTSALSVSSPPMGSRQQQELFITYLRDTSTLNKLFMKTLFHVTIDGENTNVQTNQIFAFLYQLEGAARYAGLLLAPAEGFGLQPRFLFALRAKNCLFHAVFAHFSPYLVFSSNHSNFERNPINPKKIQKNHLFSQI